MSVMAATMANSGTCPLTNKKEFNNETVKNVLSNMHSCGMYNESGQFAFSIGMPAKSGVGGGVWFVIPGVAGFCVWSPRLGEMGNSVRGMEFCKKLVQHYNFHIFDNLMSGDNVKIDPTIKKN